VRNQTLVGRERFTTPELQHLQQQLLYAQAEAVSLEKALFERVKQEVMHYGVSLRKLAHAIAHTDALLGFARVAATHRYVCPRFTESQDVIVEAGRHPVVERTLDYAFIPNDTRLDDSQSLLIVTGPNMGGKSTYLRQIALISIMAQCGSFVPATAATVPIFDRIFTRIGAGDDLAEGKSTFLVEMEETAAICQWATVKSLVILDEVGRGTSTFDGLAIAQAVVEYLYTCIKARALFATHYHELTALQETFPGIASFHAASTRTEAGIVLLHTIVAGKADGSFGIEVAKRTAMPEGIIRRAQELMAQLTQQDNLCASKENAKGQESAARYSAVQEGAIDTMMALLKHLSCDDLSPRQAFEFVCKLKEMADRHRL
jgi:DNA mismatch repair protein MutS